MAVSEPTREPVLDEYEAGRLATLYDDKEPEDVLEWMFERFHPRCALSCSFQAEDMVLLDMAWNLFPEVRVFTLDTGRLHQATYVLIDRVRQEYGIEIEVVFPDTQHVEEMVRRHGVNLFYASVPQRMLCCEVRKVVPLERKLLELDAWVTGLRREQWATRSNIRKVELDHDHDGIVKVNPLADWSQEEVWAYIREYDVPYNRLYDEGYVSIGCVPCTRAVKEGEPKRAGRWWWEEDAPKECGMHCSIETGGFIHELEAILGKDHERLQAADKGPARRPRAARSGEQEEGER